MHELFHLVQATVGGNTADRVGWLHEGAAHYVAAVGLGDNGVYSYQDIMQRHRPRAASVKAKLSSLTGPNLTSEDGDADEYSLATLAMEFLTRGRPGNGIPAIVGYWAAMRRGARSDTAFTEAFGVTPQEFYTRFEAYRAGGFRS